MQLHRRVSPGSECKTFILTWGGYEDQSSIQRRRRGRKEVGKSPCWGMVLADEVRYLTKRCMDYGKYAVHNALWLWNSSEGPEYLLKSGRKRTSE